MDEYSTSAFPIKKIFDSFIIQDECGTILKELMNCKFYSNDIKTDCVEIFNKYKECCKKK